MGLQYCDDSATNTFLREAATEAQRGGWVLANSSAR